MRKTLSGTEKAVLFLLGLEKGAAAAVMSHLNDEEIRQLAFSMRKLSDRSPEAVSEVFGEFVGELKKPRILGSGGMDYFKTLALSAVGEQRVNNIFPQKEKTRVKELLSQLDAKTGAEILSREHPQVIAVILSQLDDALSGSILKHFAEELAFEVITRVAALSSVPDEAVKEVEQMLTALVGEPRGNTKAVEGVTRAAAIVNALENDAAVKYMEKIGTDNLELAEAIRRERFTVEDLAKADARGLQTVLKEVSSEQLMLGLKNVSEEVREKFLSCLSSRAAEMLKEEMGMMGATRLKDVEVAQREILDIALRLQKEGKLVIAGQGGEKFV